MYTIIQPLNLFQCSNSKYILKSQRVKNDYTKKNFGIYIFRIPEKAKLFDLI